MTRGRSRRRRSFRVLLAPNAFKGTYDAVEVAEVWRAALSQMAGVRPDTRPMSDGGDGFIPVVRHYRRSVLEVAALVPDPLGRPVAAAWGWDPRARTAYLESAAAIGLARVAREERRPLEAGTAGLGRLLGVARGLGVRRFAIGLGGSATVDGGLGMARALGFRFEDARGNPIDRPEKLPRLARILPPVELPLGRGARVTALADVDNPLLGTTGAAVVFGPQKGAGRKEVERLERGLTRLAERWTADLNAPADLAEGKGGGAAGGLGAGCAVFLGARLASGAAWCARLAGLGEALRSADAILTGEGRFDAQSVGGKATGYILARARRAGIPAAVVCGAAEGLPEGRGAGGGVLLLDARDLGARALGDRADGPLSRGDLAVLARLAIERLR